MLERQIIELNEEVQSLENDKYELQQQLQSKDRQIQTFQVSKKRYHSVDRQIKLKTRSPMYIF